MASKDSMTTMLHQFLAKFASKTTRGTVNNGDRFTYLKKTRIMQSGFTKSNLFITYGTIVRKCHIINVGNFNPNLKHSEDEDLGERLLTKWLYLLSNHDLRVNCNLENSLLEVLERYWRWHVGRDEQCFYAIIYNLSKTVLNRWHKLTCTTDTGLLFQFRFSVLIIVG